MSAVRGGIRQSVQLLPCRRRVPVAGVVCRACFSCRPTRLFRSVTSLPPQPSPRMPTNSFDLSSASMLARALFARALAAPASLQSRAARAAAAASSLPSLLSSSSAAACFSTGGAIKPPHAQHQRHQVGGTVFSSVPRMLNAIGSQVFTDATARQILDPDVYRALKSSQETGLSMEKGAASRFCVRRITCLVGLQGNINVLNFCHSSGSTPF
jgi:hypothetical protein